MASSEIHKPVPSISIEGFTHQEVQDTPAPSKNIPFKDGHISQFSIVAVRYEDLYPFAQTLSQIGDDKDRKPILEIDIPPKEGASVIDIDDTSGNKLRQVSPSHGRSYEFFTGEESSVIFSDEYGNIYTSVTTKGNNLTNPGVKTSGITPSGAEFYGLQDSDSMVRALRASELLRANGVPTELFIKIIEPLELPYQGKIVSLEEFKSKLARQVWEDNAPADNDDRRLTRKQIPSLVEVMNNMTFFITVRGMQVPERLDDLLRSRTKEDMDKIMSRAFRYINLMEQKKILEDPSYKPHKNLSVDVETASDGYFTLILPDLIAKNIAKMHKLGLVHIYPHIGNVSTVGSIYDLDSVRGEPLGLDDDPVTKEDIIKDAMEFIYGHGDYNAPFELARLFRMQDGEYFFRAQFLDSYIREMGWVGSLEHLDDIARIWKNFDEGQRPDLMDFYLQEVFKKYKIKFKPAVTPEEFAEFVTAKLPISGGTIETFNKNGLNLTESQQQSTIAASIYLQNAKLDFEIYCRKRKFYKQATAAQRKTLVDWFYKSSHTKLNNAIGVIAEQEPEDEDKEKYWEQRREMYSKKSKSEPLKSFEAEFFYGLIAEWEWETDVVDHMAQIDDLFGGWGTVGDAPVDIDYYLNHYLDLVSQQHGLVYIHSETPEEIISMFHEFDLQHTEEHIEKQLEASDPNDKREEIVAKTLETSDRENEWWPNSWTRFLNFLRDRISDSILSQAGDRLDEIEAKYGEDNTFAVSLMICDRETGRICAEISDETYDEIVKTADQRILEFKQSYSKQNLAFSA